MTEQRNDCPCEAVKHLTELVEKHEQKLEEHEKRLYAGNENFSVINTKLNFMLSILGVIGVAIAGVMVKFVFNF